MFLLELSTRFDPFHPGSPIEAAVRHTSTVRPPRRLRYTPSYSRRLYSGRPSVQPTVRPNHAPPALYAVWYAFVCSPPAPVDPRAVRPGRRPSTAHAACAIRRLGVCCWSVLRSIGAPSEVPTTHPHVVSAVWCASKGSERAIVQRGVRIVQRVYVLRPNCRSVGRSAVRPTRRPLIPTPPALYVARRASLEGRRRSVCSLSSGA